MGMVLAASVSMAAVQGSPHEYGSGAEYGMCEVCHVPHAAAGDKRLWRLPIAVVGVTWTDSNIGRLCGTCHITGAPMFPVENTYGTTPSAQEGNAFYASAHGRAMATLTGTRATGNLEDTQDTLAGKPYVGNALIECTSCHNPHDHAVRPFLRNNANTAPGTITGVCADCHLNRYNTAVTNPALPLTSADMHPMNISYNDLALNNGTYFQEPPAAGVRTLVLAKTAAAVSSTWPLGGKMEGALTVAPGAWIGGANIGCGTCHAVHLDAARAGAAAGDDSLHLLAINNDGAANAALCEGCHGGPATATSVGTTAGDHPINKAISTLDGGPSIDLWFNTVGSTSRVERHTVASDAWPRGSTGNIICTSCHSAHASGTAEFGRLTRDQFTAASFCNACHADASPVAHHSHDANSTSLLTCTSCHASGLTGAHNGFSFQFTTGQNANSEKCEQCHTNGVVMDGFVDPVITAELNYPAPGMLADHLKTATPGSGNSHYLGPFTDNANSINVKRNAWATGMSKYGASRSTGDSGWGNPAGPSDLTGNNLICESCHSVRWNIGLLAASPANITAGWENNLLLQDYVDDSAGVAGNAVNSGLCVGCHNQTDVGNAAAGNVSNNNIFDDNIAPAGMHPMTGWSITRAADSGRGTTTLITGAGSYADGANRPAADGSTVGTEGTSYYGTNAMDCDSCHRPHLADAKGSYTGTKAGGAGQNRPVILELAGPADGEFDALCLECHNY